MIEFLKTCFSINLNEYENIGIDLEINKVLVIGFAAFIVGIILYNAYRRNINLVLSQLIRHGARSEESAKTLKELRLNGMSAIKRMLTKDNLLTKFVARVDRETETKDVATEVSIDFTTAKFYIKADKYLIAESMSTRRDSSLMNTVIACVFSVIVCLCIVACMPGILNIINALLG